MFELDKKRYSKPRYDVFHKYNCSPCNILCHIDPFRCLIRWHRQEFTICAGNSFSLFPEVSVFPFFGITFDDKWTLNNPWLSRTYCTINMALGDSIHPLNLHKSLHVGECHLCHWPAPVETLCVGLTGIQCLVWLTL